MAGRQRSRTPPPFSAVTRARTHKASIFSSPAGDLLPTSHGHPAHSQGIRYGPGGARVGGGAIVPFAPTPQQQQMWLAPSPVDAYASQLVKDANEIEVGDPCGLAR